MNNEKYLNDDMMNNAEVFTLANKNVEDNLDSPENEGYRNQKNAKTKNKTYFSLQ